MRVCATTHGCAAMVQPGMPASLRSRLASQRLAGQARPRGGKVNSRAASASTPPATHQPTTTPRGTWTEAPKPTEGDLWRTLEVNRARYNLHLQPVFITAAFVSRKYPHLLPQSDQHARFGLSPQPTRVTRHDSSVSGRTSLPHLTSARDQLSQTAFRASQMTNSCLDRGHDSMNIGRAKSARDHLNRQDKPTADHGVPCLPGAGYGGEISQSKHPYGAGSQFST